jgi:glycogen phosphorylase
MTNALATGSPSLPKPPPGLEALTELAMDLRWSWNHAADDLWQELDPGLWKATHHPNVVRQNVSRDRALADPGFCRSLEQLLQAKRAAAATPAWFQRAHPEAATSSIA